MSGLTAANTASALFRLEKQGIIKGICPKNFNTGFWDEEDYNDPDLRLSIRKEFEQYLEMLASVHNDYAMTLIEVSFKSVPTMCHNIERLGYEKSCKHLLTGLYLLRVQWDSCFPR